MKKWVESMAKWKRLDGDDFRIIKKNLLIDLKCFICLDFLLNFRFFFAGTIFMSEW